MNARTAAAVEASAAAIPNRCRPRAAARRSMIEAAAPTAMAAAVNSFASTLPSG